MARLRKPFKACTSAAYLWDDRNAAPQVGKVNLRRVHAVDGDFAALDLKQTEEEGDERTLASSSPADNAQLKGNNGLSKGGGVGVGVRPLCVKACLDVAYHTTLPAIDAPSRPALPLKIIKRTMSNLNSFSEDTVSLNLLQNSPAMLVHTSLRDTK